MADVEPILWQMLLPLFNNVVDVNTTCFVDCRKWEKIEYKMVDFSNHRRFTLRCLSKNLIAVSARLKSIFKTPKSKEIIRKAERALLNEQVRSINNSLAMFKEQRDTCMNNLSTV